LPVRTTRLMFVAAMKNVPSSNADGCGKLGPSRLQPRSGGLGAVAREVPPI
jgi:hypothetical protein